MRFILITALSCFMLIVVSYLTQQPHSSAAIKAETKFSPSPWPPELNKPYPDLELIDQDGETFKLSYLKGKVIIIEPVGMNCPACQAFAGANTKGAFQGNSVQKGIRSFEQDLPRYAQGITMPHKDIVLVQLLLYDMKLGAPQPEHAKIWAEHFKMRKGKNQFVAVSPYDLRNQASYNLIPGFQLIDKNFILRADSTGHYPKHDLYRQLIPSVATLLNR